MKSIFSKVVLLCAMLFAAGVSSAGEITVRLENPPASGKLVFLLFNSANTFGDLRDPYLTSRQDSNEENLYVLEDIPAGEYALLVHFDENGNKRIDKNFIGIPTEPLGFSNSYKPKGPPRYVRASFALSENENRHFAVRLYRPLGEFGRLGVGVGVIARSNPYRDSTSDVYRFIPAVTYTGDRLQVYGPNLQFGLIGSGQTRLAATGRYRIGVYEEDTSDFLIGMGDREDTFMLGLALQAELWGGVDLSVGYEYDILDTIGGSEASISLKKSFQIGLLGLSPEIAMNWMSSSISNHDYGVPNDKATPERPVYVLDDTISFELGLGLYIEITRDWLFVSNVSVEIFENGVVDSPIVEKDHVIKGFLAINYVF